MDWVIMPRVLAAAVPLMLVLVVAVVVMTGCWIAAASLRTGDEDERDHARRLLDGLTNLCAVLVRHDPRWSRRNEAPPRPGEE